MAISPYKVLFMAMWFINLKSAVKVIHLVEFNSWLNKIFVFLKLLLRCLQQNTHI